MADRYTKKDAEACARRLATALKVKKFGNCHRRTPKGNKSIIGCWKLDFNPTYGGARIDVIMNEDGGVDTPFGDRRQKPAQFCEQIWFAEKVLEYKQRKRRR